jgi:hypothetical protein
MQLFCESWDGIAVEQSNLGPAERIIAASLAFVDHVFHGRPGMVSKDPSSPLGVKWVFVTHKVEKVKDSDQTVKNVYALSKNGTKNVRTLLGVMTDTNQVKDAAGRIVGEYRAPGIFPEVAVYLYRQVAEVWKLDNEFAAHWASYAFTQGHRDFKVVMAAFMLVQSRKGDPVLDAGKVAFFDDDFRDIGEAMMLISTKPVKGVKDKPDLDAKQLVRIHTLLTVPGIADINRELGFGKSARRPFLGRWTSVVTKWLRYREENPKVFAGLISNGFKTTVAKLVKFTGYKPVTPQFFQLLRWKQAQAKDGRRTVAIGLEVKAADSWEGLDEATICQRISKEKQNWKRIVGMVPSSVGLTRAIVASAIEAGAMSDKDLIIATPTLEDLGLLNVQDIRERWERAGKGALDMRAANIATRVKSREVKEALVQVADVALQKAVEVSLKDQRIYVFVDISGSMEGAIEAAKDLLAKFLQAFPLDRLHVAVFNTAGREIKIQHASAAGVTNAFRGIMAGGGTSHSAGIMSLSAHKPKPGEDALFIFVGDEGEHGTFEPMVRYIGNPSAFGLVKVKDNGSIVRDTAVRLGIPCFDIDPKVFADPYAIPRMLAALVASTPVGKTAGVVNAAPRVTLVDTIIKTPLLVKPAWAA